MRVQNIFAVVAAAAALAMLASAGSASATTLETNGVKKAEPITLEASLTTGTSTVFKDTNGVVLNTCTSSTIEGRDGVTFTALNAGPISGALGQLAFANCVHEGSAIDKLGNFTVEWINGTTNGTVRLNETELTMPLTILGMVVKVKCTTANTDIGTLTGAAAGGISEIDVNAALFCGASQPSARWEGTYVMTVPGTTEEKKHAIGVVQ